jgi:hypothetical protein
VLYFVLVVGELIFLIEGQKSAAAAVVVVVTVVGEK